MLFSFLGATLVAGLLRISIVVVVSCAAICTLIYALGTAVLVESFAHLIEPSNGGDGKRDRVTSPLLIPDVDASDMDTDSISPAHSPSTRRLAVFSDTKTRRFVSSFVSFGLSCFGMKFMDVLKLYLNVHEGWWPSSVSSLSAWGFLVAFLVTSLLPTLRSSGVLSRSHDIRNSDHVIVLASILCCGIGVVCIGLAGGTWLIVVGFTVFCMGNGYTDSMISILISDGEEFQGTLQVLSLASLVESIAKVCGTSVAAVLITRASEGSFSYGPMAFLVSGAFIGAGVLFLRR
jgi:hypothetical protein